MSFVVGSYSATWNGTNIGVVEDGFSLDWVSRGEAIRADVSGDEAIDGVYRGVGMTISCILSEWDEAGAQAMFWPWAATLGEVGVIGRLYSTIAKQLVLTKCANNEAVPTSLTFPKTLIEPGFNVQTLLANKHRKIPVRLLVLPTGMDSNTADLAQCELTRLFTFA